MAINIKGWQQRPGRQWFFYSSRSNAWQVMLAVGIVLAEGGAAQAAPAYQAHMTGAQFARDMLAEPDGGANSMRRERAMGYMDGVMDAAAGMIWCPAGRAVPHEMAYVAAEELQKAARTDPERLKGSAAILVLSVLGRLYPCIGAQP